MTVEQLRNHLIAFIGDYFNGAVVAWGEHNMTKPSTPFIRLKLGRLQRPLHFINETINNAPASYIPSKTTLTVELFTHGRKITNPNGEYYFVNTAMDDMADFVNYMVSPYADEFYERIDISISPEGDILDTTAVRDSDYEYRAMQEFSVCFLQTSEGYAGISRENWEPTPSGGGTAELAEMKISDIETTDVETNSQED